MPSSTFYAVLLALVLGVGCGGGKEEEKAAKVKAAAEAEAVAEAKAAIEKAIREELNKPTGELTKADYEKVTNLHLSGNKLTEVPKGLENLTQLKELWLDSNELTDVKGLENLTQLETLYLFSNNLTDVKGLEKLTQLTSLRLPFNPDLTKAQIAELQKALPECNILSNPSK
ncbi:uncharacterized protein METZ01_LOCUS266793 [marine metagenome]|uniref:Leucine-rich repeat domain-containing protein n=1 Tax=marine metagenome TaxID=408172 RepID=A0A382JQC4_9ZZZZ